MHVTAGRPEMVRKKRSSGALTDPLEALVLSFLKKAPNPDG